MAHQLNMKRFPGVIYLALILSLSAISLGQASPFPPQCICNVKAKVLALTGRTEKVELSLKEAESQNIIEMAIEIMSIESIVREFSSEATCQNQYKVGQKIKLLPVSANSIPSDVKTGSIVQGDIERSGGCEMSISDSNEAECFEGYELSKIRVIANPS
jgi:hypothetical protein